MASQKMRVEARERERERDNGARTQASKHGSKKGYYER